MAKNEKVDVCIVGSGAAGGSMSLALAEAGFKVVVLEVGPWWNPLKDFVHAPGVMSQKFNWDVPVVQEGDRVGREPHSSWGVGGGMNHWTAAVGRLEEDDFKQGTLERQGEDWPFTHQELAPWYAKAEQQLGVSGTNQGIPDGQVKGTFANPPHVLFYSSQVLKRGFDKLGFSAYPGSVAINSRIFDGRPACNYCGGCSMGCPIGAKANTALTHFPKAMKLGVEVRPLSYVTEVTVDERGRARSLIYLDSKGERQEQEANVMVVACWTIESPRLLLNSVSSKFPRGLANSSGLVGKYLTCILGGRAGGPLDEVVDGFRGFALNNLESRHFYKTNPKNNYWGGFTLESANAGYPLSYANLRGPVWGKALVEHMKTFRRYYAMSAWGRATVSEDNRVTTDDKVKDKFGIPAAKIIYHFSDNDRKQCAAMKERGTEIFRAAGATEVFADDGPRGSYWLGGIRMGSDPARSVTDGYGQCHDVRNLFIAGPSVIPAAIGIQPTLTVVAMSNRTAEFISRNRREF